MANLRVSVEGTAWGMKTQKHCSLGATNRTGYHGRYIWMAGFFPLFMCMFENFFKEHV